MKWTCSHDDDDDDDDEQDSSDLDAETPADRRKKEKQRAQQAQAKKERQQSDVARKAVEAAQKRMKGSREQPLLDSRAGHLKTLQQLSKICLVFWFYTWLAIRPVL